MDGLEDGLEPFSNINLVFRTSNFLALFITLRVCVVSTAHIHLINFPFM